MIVTLKSSDNTEELFFNLYFKDLHLCIYWLKKKKKVLSHMHIIIIIYTNSIVNRLVEIWGRNPQTFRERENEDTRYEKYAGHLTTEKVYRWISWPFIWETTALAYTRRNKYIYIHVHNNVECEVHVRPG